MMKRAICNELFGAIDFPRSAEIVGKTGFSGMEIAPHTLFGDFSGKPETGLPEIRRILRDEGLEFAGFHWLLVGPPDLWLSAPDPAVRLKAWNHIRRLSEMGGTLGGGPLTLGSPAQRASHRFRTEGISDPDASEWFMEGLESVAEHIAATGCRLLVEALPSRFTDVVNTLAEARAAVERIGNTGIGGMFDFHNTDDEKEPWDALVRSHNGYIGHVHLNDPEGNAPVNPAEYRKAFAALDSIGYQDWISLEIFTVPEDPEQVLKGVSRFLDSLEKEGS